MQNGFMEEGAPVEVPAARGIVDNVNRISRAMREAGGTNVFLQYTTKDLMDGWSIIAERLGPKAAAHRDGFARGTHYWRLWPWLDPDEDDLMVEKKRFSAFTGNASNLHAELQARGIDTLLITGTLTNCCCETNVRDAMQLNYRVLMVSDANAALTDAEHEAALFTLGFIFADLHTTGEVVDLLPATQLA
jgi:ureidoacrylate peracid hydrolase